MKKPVLVIVDDDAAVLAALESELVEGFRDLCRVECFSTPRLVLDAVPGWSHEERSIAVLIVDQRMPGMTGVELLAALRDAAGAAAPETFHPARYANAILLTGYGGLDAAIAAKHDAAVRRYLEKPWDAAGLNHAVSQLLLDFLTESRAIEHFSFREIDSVAEATDAMTMRHDVYSRTSGATQRLLPQGAERQMDVDCYDRHARLFGLFGVGAGEKSLIGTIRVVGDAPAPLAPMLEALFQPGTALGERLREPRAHALPMLEYLLDREAVNTLRARLLAAGEQVVEPGRLALAPSHREGGAVGARHLARHIIEGSVSFFFFFYRIENAVLTCTPPHDAFYRPYGFVPAEGTTSKHTPELGTVVACLHGRIDRVPREARERCTELAQRIGRDGAACRCAAFPSCLGGPYGTGVFHDSDVLCADLAIRKCAEKTEPSS